MLSPTGLVFALVALAHGPGEGSEADPCERLRTLLATRTVESRLHRSLLGRYGMAESSAGGFSEWYGESFTNRGWAVSLGPDEEWPAVLGGTAHLLADPAFDQAITACREVRATPADRRGVIERILFQGELWAAFDNLYLEGIRLDQRHPPESRRWRRLLYELARTMRHVALRSSDMPAPEGFDRLRNVLLQPPPGAHPVEFFTTQRPFVHDVAGQFRRVNRFFFLDSRLEPGMTSRETLALLSARRLPVEDGGAALIQEDCLTVTTDRGLMETPVPALLKSYRIDPAAGNGRMIFSMHRLDRRTLQPGPEALRAASSDAEAWAHIDLPSVPGHKGKPALRAPLAVTCGACHGKYPRAFCPGGDVPDPAQFRLVTAPQHFTAERTLDIKSLSAEYAALQFYFNSELADPEDPRSPVIASEAPGDSDADLPRPPEASTPPTGSFIVILRQVSLVGLAGSALLAVGVAWSRRRKSSVLRPPSAASASVSRSRAVLLGIAGAAALLALLALRISGRPEEPSPAPPPTKNRVGEPELPPAKPVDPPVAAIPVSPAPGPVQILRRKSSELLLRNYFGGQRWRLDGVRFGLPSCMSEFLQSRDFQLWLAELRKELGPDLPAALRTLGESATSWRYRYLWTAAAAELGDASLSGFLRHQFQSREDPGLTGLAAWGLAKLGMKEDLDALAARIQADSVAGRPAVLTEYALASSGPEGLRRLVDVAVDEARRGAVTLDALSGARLGKEGRLLELGSGPSSMPALRELALGHTLPEIRAMACQALCSSGAEGVLLVLDRFKSDPEEGVREAVGNMLMRHAWSDSASALSPEVRRRMIEAIREAEEPEPGFRLRACFRLDPANGAPIVEGALEDSRNPGNRQLLFGLGEDLEEFPSEAVARIIERKARDGTITLDPATLVFMSHVRGWSDLALTNRLLGILEAPQSAPPGSVSAVLRALAQSAPTFKESEVRRITDAYRVSRDDADRRAILLGLPKLGDAGWNVVLDEARSSNAAQDRLSAWTALKEDERFQARPAVADEARAFTRFILESAQVPAGAPPVDMRVVAILRDAYLSRGVSQDLPFLDRLRDTPSGADPRVPAATWEALREAASLCGDTIRFREVAR